MRRGWMIPAFQWCLSCLTVTVVHLTNIALLNTLQSFGHKCAVQNQSNVLRDLLRWFALVTTHHEFSCFLWWPTHISDSTVVHMCDRNEYRSIYVPNLASSKTCSGASSMALQSVVQIVLQGFLHGILQGVSPGRPPRRPPRSLPTLSRGVLQGVFPRVQTRSLPRRHLELPLICVWN